MITFNLELDLESCLDSGVDGDLDLRNTTNFLSNLFSSSLCTTCLTSLTQGVEIFHPKSKLVS